MKSTIICLFLAATLWGCASRESYRKINLETNHQTALKKLESAQDRTSLRIAVAPVLSPRGTLRSYAGLVNYLGARLGRPAKLISGGSYAEVNDLLHTGGCDMAFVCSYAYLVGQQQFGLKVLVVPQVHGDIHYRSYLIVPQNSNCRDWSNLRGKTFAFSDPLSNSGYVAALYELKKRKIKPDGFFRKTIFTYSHDNSILAVADKLVDGAAVDSLVYENMVASHPELRKKIKVIARSQPYGIPPVVVSPRINPLLEGELKKALLEMDKNPSGQEALKQLMIERFVLANDHLYDSLRQTSKLVIHL